MELRIVSLDKTRFQEQEVSKKVLYIQMALLMQEIEILVNCYHRSRRGLRSMPPVQKSAQLFQVMFFLSNLAAKLYMTWGVIEKSYYGAKLSKDRAVSEIVSPGRKSITLHG